MNKSNENLSLDKSIKLHGVTIKKMPNGQYFKAIETLKGLPKDFIEKLKVNDEKFELSNFMSMEKLPELIVILLNVLPNFTMNFLSTLMDIDYDMLENTLTPVETLEIVQKFIEVNKLLDFFTIMKSIFSRTQIVQKIGFKEQ